MAHGLMPLGILAAGQIGSQLGLSAVYSIGGFLGLAIAAGGLLSLPSAVVDQALLEAEAQRGR
jgi:hypothetical protein